VKEYELSGVRRGDQTVTIPHTNSFAAVSGWRFYSDALLGRITTIVASRRWPSSSCF